MGFPRLRSVGGDERWRVSSENRHRSTAHGTTNSAWLDDACEVDRQPSQFGVDAIGSHRGQHCIAASISISLGESSMSASAPAVIPALAGVGVIVAVIFVGVYMAAGSSSHRPGASARPRRIRGRQAQAVSTRRIAPVSAYEGTTPRLSDVPRSALRPTHPSPVSQAASLLRPAMKHGLLRQSQSAGAGTGSTAAGRAPVDQRPVGTPLVRQRQVGGPAGTSSPDAAE